MSHSLNCRITQQPIVHPDCHYDEVIAIFLKVYTGVLVAFSESTLNSKPSKLVSSK